MITILNELECKVGAGEITATVALKGANQLHKPNLKLK